MLRKDASFAAGAGGEGCAPTGQAMDAMCNTWYPAGLDYTLQSGDTWFFVEGTPLRPLSELITTYHNCVGMNTVMELVRHQSYSVFHIPMLKTVW